MHRVPAFLTVGTIAGLLGAGVMWLFTRGTHSADLVPQADETSEMASKERIGVSRKFEVHPDFNSPEIIPIAKQDTGRGSSIAHRGEMSPKRAVDQSRSNAELSPVAGRDGIAALPVFSRSGGSTGIGSLLETKPTILTQESAVPAEFADAVAAARKAAEPHAKEGFAFREKYWTGTIQNGSKAVTTQLFKGNAYWFVAGTDVKSSDFDVHVYDSDGNLAEEEFSQAETSSSAQVVPKRTGAYYVIISHQQTKDFMKRKTAHWALLQGYR